MQIAALVQAGVPETLIFTDKMSGASNDRPGFLEALHYARIEETEFVVWKLDRLGRSILGLQETLKIFEKYGIRLISLTENIDQSTASGKLFINMLSLVAEMERDMIRERTLAGLARARERGVGPGRPTAMTPERVEKAEKLLSQGIRGAAALTELQEMDGPHLGRAAYYKWQKTGMKIK